MQAAEVFGYLASGLVLATFTMRTMIPLRLLGISSNVAFILYGFLDGILPVLLLHTILLPLNVYRLWEMYRLIRQVDQASDEAAHWRWLLPFMRSVSKAKGSTLFRKGDAATDMYLLTEGRVRLEEFGVVLGPGSMIGEIGVFAPDGVRTATVTCLDDCRLQRISRERIRELVFQNPAFAFHLIGVVTGRLVENVKNLEQRMAAGEASRA